MEDEFGFGGFTGEEEVTTPKNEIKEDVVDIDSGKKDVTKNGETIETIDKENNITNVGDKEIKNGDTKHDYEVGTVIEYGDNKYTVDAEGNLIDKDNKVFKEAKDVKSWIDSLNTEVEEEASNTFDINKLQETIGVSIVDENDEVIEFDNTPEGVTSYVKAVIENSKQQIIDSTIDTLYSKYPIIEDVINYYVANGNSLEGFNEVKDRSKIVLDGNNEAQCEAIIREAWKEDGRKGSVDNYIEYLKSQNLLAATAEDELNALIEKDNTVKEELAKEAEEREKRDIENQRAYWNSIYNTTVNEKKIGKYKLPDTIIINRDGKRTSATPKDFFNYIYLVDKNGRSQYENEISNKPIESRIDDNLLSAYLTFTGGTYESLVNMAINEDKVKTIKLKSKTAPKSKVKVTPKVNKTKSDDLDFGY